MSQKKNFSNQKILFLLFVSFLSLNIVFGTAYQVKTIFSYKQEISSIKNDIEKVKKEKEEVIKSSKNGESNLEDLARDEYNMVKPDDIVYVDIDNEGN